VPVLPAPYALFAAAANTANNLNVNGGSVTLSQTFPTYGTSSWNVENGFVNTLVGSVSNYEST